MRSEQAYEDDMMKRDEKDQHPLNTALGKLDNRLQRTHEMFNALEEKLGPVMAPEKDDQSTENDPVMHMERSNVLMDVERLIRKTTELEERIAIVNSRLEI